MEDVLEILPVGVVGVLAEEEFVRVLGQLPPLALPGQPALVDEVVVFHEPHEDAGQHPRHRHLIEVVLPPDLKRLGGAAALLDLRGMPPAARRRSRRSPSHERGDPRPVP